MEEMLSQEQLLEEIRGSLKQLSAEHKPFEFDDYRVKSSTGQPSNTKGTSADDLEVSQKRNASVPPGQGVSISEAIGKYFGSLGRRVADAEDGNPLVDDNMLRRSTRAPTPLPPAATPQEPSVTGPTSEQVLQDTTVTEDSPHELGPQFVGHVACEEDMEHQTVYWRPSSGKNVLVVDRAKHECFFLKWKTFKKDQRKGRELDPRYFDQMEKQSSQPPMPRNGNPSWIQEL